jgi:CubicO group peptidase (beta-lactamase class C family)
MWSTASEMARFAIQVMEAYRGRTDPVLSHEMAIEMLTPQVDDRGLGPQVYDDGGDRFYFMHPGANDGYKSVLVAYPERGQGVVILTNGDSGDALWREILYSVSVEYGWVQDNTGLYVGSVVVLLVSPLAIWLWRRASQKGDPL